MYKLQNRFQDSGWENLNIEHTLANDAIQEASELSKNAICYGMVRVIHEEHGVIATFAAGG